jgi:tetratricopeptide (TPR) repeat protein
MVMTLPALLLLLDAYPLGRIRSRADFRSVLREKIPYFTIMAAGIALEIIAELKSDVIALGSSYGLADVATQPAYRLSFYLWKTVWPVDLQPMYIFPLERDPTDAVYALCAIAVVAASLALAVLARRTAAPLVAWLAFALLLSPVLGLLQAGYHFAADRYTYFAGIAPAALVATGLARLWLKRRLVWLSAAIAVCVLAVFAVGSYRQSRIWQSSSALWQHTVAVDPENYIGHYNLAHDYATREDYDRAIDHYTRAIHLKDDEPRFWYNRALGWFAKESPERAVSDFDRALELDPDHWQALNNRGIARLALGDPEAAVADFTRALEIQPNLPGTLRNRARAFEQLGDARAARADRALSRKLR